MRILVTGSAGFIAQSLIPKLEERGHEVLGLQRYVAHRTLTRPLTIVADITSDSLIEYIGARHPGLVIHMAALASNEEANAHPAEAMRVNGMGTTRILEAMKTAGLSCPVILASSSEVYGAQEGAIDESLPFVAHNVYAASKIAAEQAVQASGRDFVIMRAFNTYGRAPIGLPKFVVDEAIYQALVHGKIEMRDPSPYRDFLFRDDHVGAYLAVVDAIAKGKDIFGKAYNFGTGECHSIGEMALMVSEITLARPPVFGRTRREGDIPRLWADSRQAERDLGWKAQYDLRAGLEKAVSEWRRRLHATSVVMEADGIIV